jgi:hypothetical protein
MTLLDVVYNEREMEFYVINLFDGVIVGRFYTRTDAEDFAHDEEANEQHRCQVEYWGG